MIFLIAVSGGYGGAFVESMGVVSLAHGIWVFTICVVIDLCTDKFKT